jgi:hypothetical protein
VKSEEQWSWRHTVFLGCVAVPSIASRVALALRWIESHALI